MTCNLDKLWEACKKGNKYVKYHSELCDEYPLLRGVGISSFAEVMLQVCEKIMADPHVAGVVKEALLSAARNEAAAFP